MKKNYTLVFVVNVDWFFVSHRLPIAIAAIESGYEVHLVMSFTNCRSMLEEMGFVLHHVSLKRGKSTLVDELKYVVALAKTIKKIEPDIVHLVTVKPVLYGGSIALLFRIPTVVAISGLGHVYTQQGLRALLRKLVVSRLYKVVFLNGKLKVIFQNSNDMEVVSTITGVDSSRAVLIPGSGVDLTKFDYSEPPSSINVLMASRLLYDKGVQEYVSAASQISKRGLKVRFLLAGSVDPDNPNSVSKYDLDKWKADGVVEILGHVADMKSLLSKISIFVLPSYYGEGLAKSLIEAAASGRPIITTSTPGCKDAVIDGLSGIVVPPKEVDTLVSALEYLVQDQELRLSMGLAGRKFAEKTFSIENVVDIHLMIYNELLQ